MRQIKLNFEIDHPPDEVFAFLTNFEALPTWRSVESIRLEPLGPAQVSTRLYSTVRAMSRKMSFQNEITALDPGSRYYADRFVNGSFPIQSSWWVQPREAGSLVSWTTEFEATGLMAFVPSVLARRIRSGQLKDLEKLKAILEAR